MVEKLLEFFTYVILCADGRIFGTFTDKEEALQWAEDNIAPMPSEIRKLLPVDDRCHDF